MRLTADDYRWKHASGQTGHRDPLVHTVPYNRRKMSLAKLITQPLLLLLIAAIVSWVILALRSWRPSSLKQRGMLGLLGVCLSFLWALSLPVTARFLEESLVLPARAPSEPPAVIVVLAGGYAPDGRGRILSVDSTERVMAAVNWWRQYPSAWLVMSGGARDTRPEGFREMTEMMDHLARGEGVPAERIFREDRSTNTREHPREVLGLEGIARETPIGLVTSRWHLRRATTEFRRYFDHVMPLSHGRARPSYELRYWIPTAGALGHSTKMLHEWIGINWYRLLALSGR